MLCSSCALIHNTNEHDDRAKFLTAQYDTTHDNISILCERHKTLCNFVCCDQFVCLYCTHRNHRHHKYTTIKQEANQVRQFVVENELSFDEMQTINETVSKSKETTNVNVQHWRNELRSVLRRRKQKCMSNLLARLSKEENRLMDEFTNLTQTHFKQYPDVLSHDYFTEVRNKQDIQVVSEKKKIKRHVFTFQSDNMIPSSEIILSEGMYTHSNHLGELSVRVNSFCPTVEEGFNGVQCHFTSDDDLHQGNFVHLFQVLIRQLDFGPSVLSHRTHH